MQPDNSDLPTERTLTLGRKLGLIAPGVLAFLLGSIELGSRSIWIDESASIAIASQHGAALSSAIARDGGNMAGYYVLLHVVQSVVGNSLFALRLPSVIASAATAILVAVLANRLFSYRAAIAAGVLAAVSLPAVYWAQDARSYAMLASFVTASYLALSYVADSSSRPNRARVAQVLYVVATTAALYMSFVGLFTICSQVLLVAVIRRHRLRVLLAAEVAVAMLAIPLVAIAIHRGSGQLFWVPRPGWTSLQQVAVALTSAGFQPNFKLGAAGIATLAVTLAILATGLCIGIANIAAVHRRFTDGTVDLGPLLCVTWLVVPLLLAFVESFVSAPSFTARDMLVLLPSIALGLGVLLTAPRVPVIVGCGVLVVVIALRLVVLIPTYGKSPEDWRQATNALVSESSPGTCIAFYPEDARMAISYYLQTQHRAELSWFRPILPTTPLAQTIASLEEYRSLDAAQLQNAASSCPSLWLVSSHEGSPSGTAGSRANHRRFVELQNSLDSRYRVHRSWSFGYAAPVTLELFTR